MGSWEAGRVGRAGKGVKPLKMRNVPFGFVNIVPKLLCSSSSSFSGDDSLKTARSIMCRTN